MVPTSLIGVKVKVLKIWNLKEEWEKDCAGGSSLLVHAYITMVHIIICACVSCVVLSTLTICACACETAQHTVLLAQGKRS